MSNRSDDPAISDRTHLDPMQRQRWASARYFGDHRDPREIAKELGVPEGEVARLIEDDSKRVEHAKRTHIITDRRQAECQHGHGPFEQVQWSLDPMPTPNGRSELPPILQPFWSQCPVCDSGRQSEANARDAEIRNNVTEKQAYRARMAAAAGIPDRFKEATVWNWHRTIDKQRTNWNWAREYCSAFEIVLESGRSGVFAGQPGTGKTHLAIGILQHILEKGGTGLYVTVMSMLGRIKDTYNKAATETEQRVVNELKSVDLLVIDEVGKSLDTNYELAQFFRLLDLRYSHCKPTLLVTNMGRDEFKSFIGEAIADRLREGGGAILTFDWASHRNSSKPSKEEP